MQVMTPLTAEALSRTPSCTVSTMLVRRGEEGFHVSKSSTSPVLFRLHAITSASNYSSEYVCACVSMVVHCVHNSLCVIEILNHLQTRERENRRKADVAASWN